MAIIINENSKIIIQGITGKTGRSFANRMQSYQTPLVAGVTPGKGGQSVSGIPVFNFVGEAVSQFDANVSFVSVPAAHVEQAVYEAIDAGIEVIVIYTEGLDPHTSMKIITYAKLHQVTLLGPNSAGIVSPGKANVSDIHDSILTPGNIGIVSRSGTLTYEIVDLLKQHGLGISTIACLGGDPLIGTRHHEVLRDFEDDQETDLVVYLGEIGGEDELFSAEFIKDMQTPVFSYIAGVHAPPGKKMGHAGAIANRGDETAEAKQRVLEEAGAVPLDIILDLISRIQELEETKGLVLG
ncbi:CoA-binding protein [Lentibacillus sp. CBA3610]|uniref:succinate--CoA ligase subunit alpha n=1 Tax=Lentibacillus sp. CBA3610 TaxID=2518176 RepID=UPI001595DBC3|nr:CoA-binding protein [Lentibacillus sp. CBA3610]QKY70271.1 succinate--CoA ligase subunit alpha [Lentibacillus sp. CBA3610]